MFCAEMCYGLIHHFVYVQVLGDKLVQYSDRGSMPYLEATLMEIQRVSMIGKI